MIVRPAKYGLPSFAGGHLTVPALVLTSPVGRLGHVRAPTRHGIDEPLLAEYRESTASGFPRDAVQLRQRLLRRKRTPRGQVTALDLGGQIGSDLPVGRLRGPVINFSR